jgi:putative heme-binding domain-containing protein
MPPKTLLLLLALFTGICSAQQRVPWTTSKIHGTPEPPLPYRVERAFPSLTFSHPMEVAVIPGTNRLVVIEEGGKLHSFPNDDSVGRADAFGDLAKFDAVITQAYALTFHPRFAANRLMYVWGIADKPDKSSKHEGTRIIEFKVTEDSPPQLDLTSGRVVFSWAFGGHNGGNMRFGPDGMLYIGTGDGGFADPPDGKVSGQDISDVLASILRIDVDHPDAGRNYGIPKDNPFVTTPKARGEVWAYGLRNPWRLSFNPKTGDLYAGDVGWELWEMVHRIQRGGNYGWSLTEGGKQDVRPDRLAGPSPILPPLAVHSHEEAASITGGEFYHGTKFADLQGAYIYGDWQMGTFWALKAEGDRVTELREICRSALMPVGFGVAEDGELLICDYGNSGLWRLARNPNAGKKSNFPRRLSETGLFSNAAKQIPSPGVVPYQINVERWADHATAQRWAGLPADLGVTVADKSLGVMEPGRWVFPEGTVMAKTYAMEMERGNPATSRRIETQVLHFDGVLWGAYSYKWNAEQSDAELVQARGDEITISVKDKTAPGGELKQKWRFFSRVECLRCHNPWDNYAPGFAALQLDRVTPEATGRQLDVFQQLGLTPAQPKLADPHGKIGSLEVRARSYLHANCSTCHRFNGGGAVPTFLNIEVLLKEAKLIDFKPVQGDLGMPDARVIARGDPARSALLYRMASEGRGHMPYLGSKLVDDKGLLLVRDWIAGMSPNPKDVSEVTKNQREAEEVALTKLKAGDASALDELLTTGSGALCVALAIVDGSLKEDIRAQAIAKGSAIPDPLRVALFERFLPEAQRRKVLGNDLKVEHLLAMKGDPARGRTLFSAVCVACHRINGAGIDFGPDLSHIGTKWNRASMIDQILTPSKVVEPQWQLTTMQLASGESKTGFVTERTNDQVTLKMPGGITEKIPAKQISKSSPSRVSAMPEGMLQSLTAQEAADLLEFLASLK